MQDETLGGLPTAAGAESVVKHDEQSAAMPAGVVNASVESESGMSKAAIDEGRLVAAWPAILDGLEANCTDPKQARGVRTWLAAGKVHPRSVSDGQLVLECPTALFQAQIRDRFADQLAGIVGEQLSVAIDEVVCRVTRQAMTRHRQRVDDQATQAHADAAEQQVTRSLRREGWGQGFKILRDFVVGSSNRHAYDAVRRVLDVPDLAANPLFIHGSSGLGKTHLEQGLAVSFKHQYPHSTVVYMSCEQFKNAYLAACETGTKGLQAFRVKLRHADLLLIDDIHFLSRGQMVKTKEELFWTIDELSGKGKKVVITSDAHPSDIKYLEERFVQRFTGGLVVRLDQPDMQVRREVVVAKASAHGVTLPQEAVEFIADHITDNIRELEGAVNKLVAFAGSLDRRIDLQLARQALADAIGRDQSEPRLKVILRAVADYFDITAEDILGRGRQGPRSTARHIAMYAFKASGSDTYAAVGQAFGVKSHSTVAYACEQVGKYRATDPDVDRFVDDLLLRVRRR